VGENLLELKLIKAAIHMRKIAQATSVFEVVIYLVFSIFLISEIVLAIWSVNIL
jgi:hypothetical protein